MVCSCPVHVQDLGPHERSRARSATACVLSGVTQHKLQSALQMAATCAGLGGAQKRPSCEPKLVAASSRLGAY